MTTSAISHPTSPASIGRKIRSALFLLTLLHTEAHRWRQSTAKIEVFPDGLLTTDRVSQAAEEYNHLPLISPRLCIHQTTGLPLPKNQQMDGINTVQFVKIGTPAYTNLWLDQSTLPPTLLEFDVYLDPDWVTTPEMLHLLLLHELGHVMGLEHPETKEDSVMGYAVHSSDGTAATAEQETKILHLTKNDISNLYTLLLSSSPHRTAIRGQLFKVRMDPALPTSLAVQKKYFC